MVFFNRLNMQYSLTSRYTGECHGCFWWITVFRLGIPRDLYVRPLICFYSYIRMTPVVTSVCGAQFTTVTLVGLMSALILMSEWCPLWHRFVVRNSWKIRWLTRWRFYLNSSPRANSFWKQTSFVSWFQLVACDWRVPCLNRCLTNHYTGAGHVRFSCFL